MLENRENWVPRLINGRYVIIDKETKEVINNFQGYGSKTEEKCWNWIRNQLRQWGVETTSTKIISAINPLF